MRLRHRNQWLDLRVTHDALQLSSEAHGDRIITLNFAGRRDSVTPGSKHMITFER
jgi:hypothetical protein